MEESIPDRSPPAETWVSDDTPEQRCVRQWECTSPLCLGHKSIPNDDVAVVAAFSVKLRPSCPYRPRLRADDSGGAQNIAFRNAGGRQRRFSQHSIRSLILPYYCEVLSSQLLRLARGFAHRASGNIIHERTRHWFLGPIRSSRNPCLSFIKPRPLCSVCSLASNGSSRPSNFEVSHAGLYASEKWRPKMAGPQCAQNASGETR